MFKIVTVVGARPQFVKASVLSRAIRKSDEFEEVLIHTGQHFDENMSSIFFTELGMSDPDYNLGIGGLSHGAQTGRMLEGIEKILLDEKPDVLLVYGDTDSTAAGALAASKLHIPVAHVEAGLRSFNKRMPEEQNRIITDHLSSWLFTPTATASSNLRKEGIAESAIHEVGDIMLDMAKWVTNRSSESDSLIKTLELEKGAYALATVHRAENTDSPEKLRSIISGLSRISESLMPVVLPLHPRTKKYLSEFSIELPDNNRFKIVDPLGYLEFSELISGAQIILTDSGGLQKEAFFHSVPCVTLRDETEWGELVECGANLLVDALDEDSIFEVAGEMKEKPVPELPLYGSGNTADLILRCLSEKQ